MVRPTYLHRTYNLLLNICTVCLWSGVSGQGPYKSINGGTAIRLLEPCDDDCEWTTSQQANMQAERWYPTVETLQDGSLAIVSIYAITASRYHRQG